jgi:hypothetical protein
MVLVGCGWLAGCYQYVRVDPTAVPAGSRARTELTSQGSIRLAETLGWEERRRVEGRIIEASPEGGMLLEVVGESGATPVGVSSRPLFERVSIPFEDLLSVELKRLSRGRTAALVGAGVGTAAAIVAAAFDLGGFGGGDEDNPPVDQFTFPLFSFAIGR